MRSKVILYSLVAMVLAIMIFESPAHARSMTAKCKESSSKCISEAIKRCDGEYRVIDSESHAGGLLADTLPGPVIWYSLTYSCGPSDGREPSFRFRGPRYEAQPLVNPGIGAGLRPVSVREMMRYCKGEAADRFRQRPGNILVLPVETTSNGYMVYGQFPPYGQNVRTFSCRFDRYRQFVRIR
jgi:hypothetical protein